MCPVAAGAEGSSEKRAQASSLRLYVLNLSLLILLGVGISGWLLYYTDWFPIFGGLLGLGSLFAWIAFVSNLVSKNRKEQMQSGFESIFLECKGAWIVVVGVSLFFFLWAASRGTIWINSYGDDLDRAVEIRAIEEGVQWWTRAGEARYLPARSVQKYLIGTKWFGSRDYHVKLSGLPAAVVKVRPFRREPLIIPSSFLRQPVLLVKPSHALSGIAENTDPGATFKLVILINDKETGGINPYRGEAVWVGSDADVSIPEPRRDRWRLELIKDNIPEAVLVRWLTPKAIAPYTSLETGDRVTASVLRPDKTVYATVTETLRILSRIQDFPQEVELK